MAMPPDPNPGRTPVKKLPLRNRIDPTPASDHARTSPAVPASSSRSISSPIPPAPPPDALHETLDLLGTVLASVSDRVDAQTDALDRINKTATEARQAAFAARAQTDPKRYGELVGETIHGAIGDTLARLAKSSYQLEEQMRATQGVLKQAAEDKLALLRDVQTREAKAARLKRSLPWLALGAVALALVLSVALPRFMAGNAATCAAIGGLWQVTTKGVQACVFYRL